MPNRHQAKNTKKSKAGLPALPDFHVPVEDFKFYVVYWKDIESDPSWRELKDIQASQPAICISTGWLVKQNKDVHVLMSDFNFNKEQKLGEGGSSTVIPTSCVLKLIEIDV